MAHVAATVALATVKFTRHHIKELSVREYIEAGVELVLSSLLAVSFFECPEESRRDEQELQTLYTMAWPPAILSAFIVYGHRVSKTLGPVPKHFDRNLRRSKVFTWIYSLLFLIWDPDMVLKRGPALHVAIVFFVCDVVRFELEISGLMEGDDDDDDELERLVAAVKALETDHPPHPSFPSAGAGSSKHAPPSRVSNALHDHLALSSSSVSSTQWPPHKTQAQASRALERQSTDSVTHDFVELTTPAPTATNVDDTSNEPASLENSKAPAPSIATGDKSVTSSSTARGAVFEF